MLAREMTTVLVAAVIGCGGGDFGATQGGVQDMGLARALIAEGRVPPAAAFVVEGMFSEHELGLEGAPCATDLCVRAATGVAPGLDGETAGWIQLGLSSPFKPETYQAPPLSVVAAVDVSGSMGWDYGKRETPAAIAIATLRSIAARLRPEDRIAVITYGSNVVTKLELTPGDDRPAIDAAIDRIGGGGSTNMEAGMRRAFAIAGAATTPDVRVMVFTDVQPNVGATSASEFERMAAGAAEDGVGLTVFGCGYGLDPERLLAMSHLRGGNAFNLFDLEDVDELMADDWPYLASPIAYDLELGFDGGEPRALFGFPADAAGEVGLEIATVFLSRRKGALLVQTAEAIDATVELRYRDRAGVDHAESLAVSSADRELDARGHWAEQSAVAKTTALAVAVTGMAEAARLYPGDRAAALEQASRVADRLAADAETLGDPALVPEVELARALRDLIAAGAPRGNLYP